MNLMEIIRNVALPIADQQTKSVQTSVSHLPWLGQDAQGQPVYGEAVPVAAVLERSQRELRTLTGEITVASWRLTIPRPLAPNGEPGRQEPIDPRDRFELPGDIAAQVLTVEAFIDAGTGAPAMLQVWLG